MSKPRSRKRIAQILGIVRVALAILIVVAVVNIVRILMDYNKSDTLYKDTSSKYTSTTYDINEIYETAQSSEDVAGLSEETGIAESSITPTDDEMADSSSEVTSPAPSMPWYQMISVDLESLQAVNSDIIGWIYFENEEISYPILYSGDNDTYLYTSYTGQSMSAGSIFLERTNSPDFTDRHTIIYGHNMKNLSMFGRLRYYRQSGYYSSHKYFQIITNGARYRYQIVAYKEVLETDSLYTTYFASDEAYAQFINEQILAGPSIGLSEYTSAIEAMQTNLAHRVQGGGDATTLPRIVTLSTCTTTGKRFTVSAVRVDVAN